MKILIKVTHFYKFIYILIETIVSSEGGKTIKSRDAPPLPHPGVLWHRDSFIFGKYYECINSTFDIFAFDIFYFRRFFFLSNLYISKRLLWTNKSEDCFEVAVSNLCVQTAAIFLWRTITLFSYC